MTAELERGLRLLEQRAAVLEAAEADFEKRVFVAAEKLAAEMVLEARNERNAARQRARRLQQRLDLRQNLEAGSLMNPHDHLMG